MLVSVSTRLLRVTSSRIFLVSVMGMLEYISEMSREAKEVEGVNEVCRNWFKKSEEFVTLNALGSAAGRLRLWVKDLESLYAGAFRQLTRGRMGCSGLCSLIKPFMVGAEGLRLMNFHLELGE